MTTVVERERTLSAGLPDRTGERVTIQGWTHRRRRLSEVSFLLVRDRTGIAQVVVRDEAARRAVEELGEETVVSVEGTVTANPQAPGGYELTAPVVTPLGPRAETPPVELWRPSLEGSLPHLLDHGPVTWRHPAQQAVWRVAAASLRGFRATLDALGFTEVQTPKVVSGSTESGAAVFEVDWFGRPAYLAQSPQFYKQMMVGVLERVYEAGPVFRAEPHDTARHLAEYVSLDVELGFVRDHRDVLAVLREVVAGMVEAVRPVAAQAGGAGGAGAGWPALPEVPAEIPVVHFRDALARLGASLDEPDLSPEHERALGAWAREAYGSDFLAVEGYPMAKRPFYTHPEPGDERWSNSFDLLFRGLELVTGGQRRHRYADYEQALLARGEDPQAYAPYLRTFRYGMPPHGGFAIGLERWTARLTGAENLRRVTLFPRDLHRLTP